MRHDTACRAAAGLLPWTRTRPAVKVARGVRKDVSPWRGCWLLVGLPAGPKAVPSAAEHPRRSTFGQRCYRRLGVALSPSPSLKGPQHKFSKNVPFTCRRSCDSERRSVRLEHANGKCDLFHQICLPAAGIRVWLPQPHGSQLLISCGRVYSSFRTIYEKKKTFCKETKVFSFWESPFLEAFRSIRAQLEKQCVGLTSRPRPMVPDVARPSGAPKGPRPGQLRPSEEPVCWATGSNPLAGL